MKHKIIAVYEQLQKILTTFITWPETVLLSPPAYPFVRFQINPMMENGVCLYLHVQVMELLSLQSKHIPDNILEFTINQHGGNSFGPNEGLLLVDVENRFERYIDILLDNFGLKEQFKAPITIHELEPFPENTEPHFVDQTSMYSYIVKPWCIMHKGGDNPDTIILANSQTGRRFELDLTNLK